jgi:hypothetical protein
MRAPVYRNIETTSTVLGLAFPTEALVMMALGSLAVLLLPPLLSAITTLSTYASIRLINRGRAPAFVQHYVAWKVRQLRAQGNLSAAARVRCPKLPFGPYEFRDAPRKASNE